jgi:hypothetical protein
MNNTASNNVQIGLNRSRKSSSTSSISIGSSGNSNATTSNISSSSSSTCAGLSEPLRMEIAATLTLNNVVRLEDIEIIDPSYALASCHLFDHHLLALEKELLQYLTTRYQLFEQSNEYIYMIAYHQALHCSSIHSYYHKLKFLGDFFSGELKPGSVIHWADPRARGVLFLKYSQPVVTEEDNLDFTLSHDVQSSWRPVGDRVQLAVPNILAGRFDLCKRHPPTSLDAS